MLPCAEPRRFCLNLPPLYDQLIRGFVSYDGILLLLDGSHNILHLLVRRAAELLLQDVVIDVHGALNHIFHLTVFDFVLPFTVISPCILPMGASYDAGPTL